MRRGKTLNFAKVPNSIIYTGLHPSANAQQHVITHANQASDDPYHHGVVPPLIGGVGTALLVPLGLLSLSLPSSGRGRDVM